MERLKYLYASFLEQENPHLVNRIEVLRELFVQKNLDGCMIFEEKNMLYFTGFSGGSLLLIPKEGESTLFVYDINFEAAIEEANNASIFHMKAGEDLYMKISDMASQLKLQHIGFDSMRATSYLKFKDALKDSELKIADDLVWSLRKVKDKAELRLIDKAAKLTSKGMLKAFDIIEAGLDEREVATEIEYEMRKAGSDGVAFETIVSSGSKSAFPHGGIGNRKIRKGDFVVIDMGAKVRGYCADLTRTFIIGESSQRQVKIFDTVKKAHSMAISLIKAGVEVKDIDKAARDYIEKNSYGKLFVHSLGHGVGLDVHEPPTLSSSSQDVLTIGNVVTVEPGIYVPKFGGIRIEDTVLVLKESAKKLTKVPVDWSP